MANNLDAKARLGRHFEAEIIEQPTVLQRFLTGQTEPVERLASTYDKCAPAFGLIAARGSSLNAGRYAQILWGERHGLMVGAVNPSLFTMYRKPPSVHRSLLFGISQSGASPDIVAVMSAARGQAALCVAITNEPRSALANAADYVLPLDAGPETSVAASKTYSASLFALACLSAKLNGDAAQDIAQIPEAVALAHDVRRQTAFEDIARKINGASGIFVCGRGYNLCTAFEIALKLKETAQVHAEPLSSAELLHGPITIAGNKIPVLLVATGSSFSADARSCLERLRLASVPNFLITDDPRLGEEADHALILPRVVDWLLPLVAIVPGQWLALAVSRQRAIDADAPAGLRKITLTF